jgi:membrane AbrB-like protein
MVIMAEAFGADARLVALMQYLRVAMVVMTSALVARVLGAVAPETPPFVLDPKGFALAVGVALAGLAVGLALRKVPAGALLVPMSLGVALPLLGQPLQLPAPVVAFAATLLGWNIGLTFTRESLVRAAALLPKMLASIVALMVACALVGLVLAKVLGLDLMTAWLATSPGGMDSLALIASASKQVDVPFVIAMQASRFLTLVLVGPLLARTVARLAQR